jgi:hypothetical protein
LPAGAFAEDRFADSRQETSKAGLHGFSPFPHDIRIAFAKTGPQQTFVFGLRRAKRHSSGFPPRSGRLKQLSTKEKSGYPAVPLPLKRISSGGWGIDLSRRPGGFQDSGKGFLNFR